MFLKAVHEEHYHDDKGDDNDDNDIHGDDTEDEVSDDNNEYVATCAKALLDLCPISSDCNQMTRRSACLCLGLKHPHYLTRHQKLVGSKPGTHSMQVT